MDETETIEKFFVLLLYVQFLIFNNCCVKLLEIEHITFCIFSFLNLSVP